MSLPSNVHVSKHPCLLAKLGRLRSRETEAREVKSLVNDIALIVGCEALASTLTAVDGPKVTTSSSRSLCLYFSIYIFVPSNGLRSLICDYVVHI